MSGYMMRTNDNVIVRNIEMVVPRAQRMEGVYIFDFELCMHYTEAVVDEAYMKMQWMMLEDSEKKELIKRMKEVLNHSP